MLDIKLILIDLFLNFLFYLVDPSVVLALQLLPRIVVVVAEQTFLGGFEDLSDLGQFHLQTFNHFFIVSNVLVKDGLVVKPLVLLEYLRIYFPVVVFV